MIKIKVFELRYLDLGRVYVFRFLAPGSKNRYPSSEKYLPAL